MWLLQAALSWCSLVLLATIIGYNTGSGSDHDNDMLSAQNAACDTQLYSSEATSLYCCLMKWANAFMSVRATAVQ